MDVNTWKMTVCKKTYPLSLFHWHRLTNYGVYSLRTSDSLSTHIQTLPGWLASYWMIPSLVFFFPPLGASKLGGLKKNDYDAKLKQLNKVTLGCFSLVKTLRALKMLLKLYRFFFPFYSQSKITF